MMTIKSRQSYRNQLIVNSPSCLIVQQILSLVSGKTRFCKFLIGPFKNISSWWTGRDSNNHTYWHGNASDSETGCACASTGSCERFLRCINVGDKVYRLKVLMTL